MTQATAPMLRRNRRTRAQGMVEFALVLPILLFVFFAIVDFGWMVFNYAQLYNSLREGLRYGSVSGYGSTPQYLDCAAIRQFIIDHAGFSGIKATDITILYDDGRPASTATDASALGACGTTSFSQNSSYLSTDGKGARNPDMGDRINIRLNVTVPFLTPFIRTLVPGGGIQMTMNSSRSIFPGGLG